MMGWNQFIEEKRKRDEREKAIKDTIISILIALFILNDWNFTIDKIVEFLESLY